MYSGKQCCGADIISFGSTPASPSLKYELQLWLMLWLWLRLRIVLIDTLKNAVIELTVRIKIVTIYTKTSLDINFFYKISSSL
jgi:hypothetical protein